jgi:hypothetical protein
MQANIVSCANAINKPDFPALVWPTSTIRDGAAALMSAKPNTG